VTALSKIIKMLCIIFGLFFCIVNNGFIVKLCIDLVKIHLVLDIESSRHTNDIINTFPHKK
jgi:hypothetical protein